jgi:hypothetical protein
MMWIMAESWQNIPIGAKNWACRPPSATLMPLGKKAALEDTKGRLRRDLARKTKK